MTDHDIAKNISYAVGHFLEYHSAYVIAFLSVMWAMTVWAFRSVIRKYDFASKEHVVHEIRQCKNEVDKRDDQLEQELNTVKNELERNREINTSEHNNIRDLIIKHLDK